MTVAGRVDTWRPERTDEYLVVSGAFPPLAEVDAQGAFWLTVPEGEACIYLLGSHAWPTAGYGFAAAAGDRIELDVPIPRRLPFR